MRDRHCLQCGVFVPVRKGWRFQTTRRAGGLVHDTCLDKYNTHKKEVGRIKKLIRERHRRKAHPEYGRKYSHDYYLRNRLKIINRNYIYYHTNAEILRAYQRSRYKTKHYTNTETDDIFLVKIWPRWKTQGGWII